MLEFALLLVLQGCILWHNWWPLLTGEASYYTMYLAHSRVTADCNLMVHYLQLSCMCWCQCLTYSLGQTLHPQVPYMGAAAWQAGERYPTVQRPQADTPGHILITV